MKEHPFGGHDLGADAIRGRRAMSNRGSVSARPMVTAQEQCVCGHSLGSHGNGSNAAFQKASGWWACIAHGCKCLLFEIQEPIYDE